MSEHQEPTAGNDAGAERAAFCEELAPHLADALELLGVEDADLSDGRALADTVYCLGYRVLPPEGGKP